MGQRAGKLRNRGTLQKPRAKDDRDTIGEPLSPWVSIGPLWFGLEPLGSRDTFASEQAQGTASHRVTMRYRRDVQTAWRIKLTDGGKDRFFYFDGPLVSPDEMREVLTGLVAERAK